MSLPKPLFSFDLTLIDGQLDKNNASIRSHSRFHELSCSLCAVHSRENSKIYFDLHEFMLVNQLAEKEIPMRYDIYKISSSLELNNDSFFHF